MSVSFPCPACELKRIISLATDLTPKFCTDKKENLKIESGGRTWRQNLETVGVTEHGVSEALKS